MWMSLRKCLFNNDFKNVMHKWTTLIGYIKNNFWDRISVACFYDRNFIDVL